MSDEISATALPSKVGMMTFCLDRKDLWSGKFPISFSALNAAVKWHLPDSLQDVQHTRLEDSAGFARYAVTLNGVGNLGEISLRELPDKRFTELIITVPKPSRSPQWTDEEKFLIEAQPDRQSSLQIRYEIADRIAEEREGILKWQEIIFKKFLERLFSDPEIVQALIDFDTNNVTTQGDSYLEQRSREQMNPVILRQVITKHFSDSELRDLCFDLNIDYENLPGQGKGDKARELVAYVGRHNRIAELVKEVRSLRPNADWPNTMNDGSDSMMVSESIP